MTNTNVQIDNMTKHNRRQTGILVSLCAFNTIHK